MIEQDLLAVELNHHAQHIDSLTCSSRCGICVCDDARYRSVCFPPTAKLNKDISTCRKVLEAAGCRGWQRGKTKLFLKYTHVTELTAILQQKAKEEEARLAAIADARRKREEEEARIEAERLRQVEEIRSKAEAQPSSIVNQPDPPPAPRPIGKVKKASMFVKKTPPSNTAHFASTTFPSPPLTPASASDDDAVGGTTDTAASAAVPTIAIDEDGDTNRGRGNAKRSTRDKGKMLQRNKTGIKGKKFSVRTLGAMFGGKKQPSSRAAERGGANAGPSSLPEVDEEPAHAF
jgi:hypothetical protein